ncbi:hypothetical protein ACQF4J_35870 [Streptomyces sp. C1-1]|uniref:hypothetical protein n=1 Tax=Streptomyces sp. C1-1 TaxID=3231173 RepID=UPI003D08D671
MAVSLGMRISGLLVAGAVAVAVAAFGGDGSGGPDGRGGGGPVVTAEPSGRPPTPAPSVSPTPRQSPAGEAGDVVNHSAPPRTHRGTAPHPSASPTPSPVDRPLSSPAWLPPGPVSPDADSVPDTSSLYDRLRDPAQCRTALALIPRTPAGPDRRLLRGLAEACLAVQGHGGSWDTAAADHTALAGRADTCKDRAAYAVLGALLDFHRRHPHATVLLRTAPGGTPACAYRVAGVDTGQARPADTVGIELRGTYFDPAELTRYGEVFIGGERLDGPPVIRSRNGDRLVLTAVVPALDGYPRTVDVVVRYGSAEARLPDAFTVVAPTVVPSADPPSGTPQGVLPLGPLAAHLPRP